jgi:hypothetical protein
MRKKVSIEELRLKKEKRRLRFVQLGIRPLLVMLWVSLSVYVLSMVSAVFYYWPQAHLFGWLVMPALLVFCWSIGFGYARNHVSVNAFVTAFSLVIEYRHLIADDFWLVGSLGRIMVVIFALIIYCKMKDPVFSRFYDAV